MQGSGQAAKLAQLSGDFPDEMRRELDGVLHHVGVLLDVLLHHLDLLRRLLDVLVISQLQLRELGGGQRLFQRLHGAGGAVDAVHAVRMGRSGMQGGKNDGGKGNLLHGVLLKGANPVRSSTFPARRPAHAGP